LNVAEKSSVLSEDDYQNILRICESMSLVMERSPSVFENTEEEHIRVHYGCVLYGSLESRVGRVFRLARASPELGMLEPGGT
jgi:hypothetical protein